MPAQIRVRDIAKKIGKSEKDVIFQLQSLGAEVTEPDQVVTVEVIRALATGKELTTANRMVIMREDKPRPTRKENVRPPRPTVRPRVRAQTAIAKASATPPSDR